MSLFITFSFLYIIYQKSGYKYFENIYVLCKYLYNKKIMFETLSNKSLGQKVAKIKEKLPRNI